MTTMRIPSEFNDESLYRRRRRRGENADTYRKLVRMVIGLALVLVVMRQAARPEIYQTFFGGQRGEEVVPISAPPRLMAGDSAAPPTPLPTLEIDPDDRAVAAKIIAQLRLSDRRQWLVALSRWQTGRPVQMVPSTVDSVRSVMQEESEDPQRTAAWYELLEAFEQQVAAGDASTPIAKTYAPALAAWVAALDDAADAEVVDGSVWRSGDFDSFYRYLDQAPWMSADRLPTTGVLPLLQQPEVYRTEMVRVSGRVARAERIEAQDNPYGITQYWQLWLRPSDGADRPFLVIVPNVPPAVEDVGADANLEDGPPVVMVGRFLKRLAYPSQAGADLAPVVVGRLLTRRPTAASVTATSTAKSDVNDTTRLLWMVAVAVVVGVVIAALTMWRTSVAAQRSREIRSANRKQPNLSELQHPLPEERS
jgi:hypothetical protein